MKGKKVVPHILGQSLVGIFVWILEAFHGIAVPSPVVVMMCTVMTVAVSLATPDHMEADE